MVLLKDYHVLRVLEVLCEGEFAYGLEGDDLVGREAAGTRWNKAATHWAHTTGWGSLFPASHLATGKRGSPYLKI